MRYLLIIVIGAILIVFHPVAAQEDLRILPPNPFYFLKEWQRGIKVALSGPRKAEAILEVLQDKAIDFSRTGNDKILHSYKESLRQLGGRIAEVAQSAELLDALFDHALAHAAIFDRQILTTGFDAERFSAAVARRHGELRELTALELTADIEDGLLPRWREEWLIELIGRLSAREYLLDEINNLNGDLLPRLQVLDQARELVSDSDLKSKLNLLRQQILDKAAAGISAAIAQSAIDSASALVAELGLARAQFHLAQAQQLQANGNYVAAFGQASAASAVAKNALPPKPSLAELKKQYEELTEQFQNRPEAKKLLDEAKKSLRRQSLTQLRIILATLRNLP